MDHTFIFYSSGLVVGGLVFRVFMYFRKKKTIPAQDQCGALLINGSERCRQKAGQCFDSGNVDLDHLFTKHGGTNHVSESMFEGTDGLREALRQIDLVLPLQDKETSHSRASREVLLWVRAHERCQRIVSEEPELPTYPEKEILEAIRQNPVSALRSVVGVAKAGIMDRLRR